MDRKKKTPPLDGRISEDRQAASIVPARGRSELYAESSEGPAERLPVSPFAEGTIAENIFRPPAGDRTPVTRSSHRKPIVVSKERVKIQIRKGVGLTDSPGASVSGLGETTDHVSLSDDSDEPLGEGVRKPESRLPKWVIKNPSRPLAANKIRSWKLALPDEDWEFADSSHALRYPQRKKARLSEGRELTTKQRAQIEAKTFSRLCLLPR